MGIKSNQQRSKEIALLIRNWIEERDSRKDYADWIQTSGPTAFKGVRRKDLAAALGVSTSSLNENESSVELRNAEFRWCRNHVQQQKTSKASSAKLGLARAGDQRAKEQASSMEGNSSELKAENRILRSRLAKWEAVEKVLMENARAPRRAFTEE